VFSRGQGKGEQSVSDIEVMMTELARASVALKRSLYRRDDFVSTTPEGTDGPRTTVHTCAVCERSAAGQGAEVRHKSGCALARLQRAQKALREAWPEVFAKKPAPGAPSSAPLSASCPDLVQMPIPVSRPAV
jgi:hypothetical protein